MALYDQNNEKFDLCNIILLQPKTDSIAKILQQSNVIDLTSFLLRVVVLLYNCKLYFLRTPRRRV